jgi:hypothetical protein
MLVRIRFVLVKIINTSGMVKMVVIKMILVQLPVLTCMSTQLLTPNGVARIVTPIKTWWKPKKTKTLIVYVRLVTISTDSTLVLKLNNLVEVLPLLVLTSKKILNVSRDVKEIKDS